MLRIDGTTRVIDKSFIGIEPKRRWLQDLIRERIAPDLVLETSQAGWILRVPGTFGSIHVIVQFSDFESTPHDPSFDSWDPTIEGFKPPLSCPLPAPGLTTPRHRLWQRSKEGGVFAYDFLNLAYWMLTRVEEVGRTDLDAHNRFPATASHAFRHGYLERPIVDEWFEVFGQMVDRVWPGLQRVTPTFTTTVSHDVDSPSRYAFGGVWALGRIMAGDLVLRRDPYRFLQGPGIRWRSRKTLDKDDPWNTFEWIMSRSEERGLTSAFYFICGRTSPSYDASYDPEDIRIRQLLRRIHARGHEIGLHPSYGTYREPTSLAEEFARLRLICAEEDIFQQKWGGRMHFLRWDMPMTLRAWEAAGLDYDTTLSYADRPGFRCGTCHEYQAFDPVEKRPLNLRLRPLVAMECTVMAPRYLGLGNGQEAFDKFAGLKQTCRTMRGNFTTLWHNTYFESSPYRELYLALLDV